MPNKENLERLKAVVEESELVRYNYYKDGCCCVVGHAVELMENPTLINVLKNNNESSCARDSDIKNTVVPDVCKHYGITPGELIRLQELNDDKTLSKVDVIMYIDRLISKE